MFKKWVNVRCLKKIKSSYKATERNCAYVLYL